MSNETKDLKVHLKVKFLYPGILLKGDVYTEDGVKVIDGAQPITGAIIQELTNKGVESVYYTRNPFGDKTFGANLVPDRKALEETVALVQEIESSIRTKSMLPVELIHKTVSDIAERISVEKGVILSLMELKEYDDYIYTHSINVCLISMLFAKKMNMPSEFVKNVGIAGLLHDLGSLLISPDIMNKPSNLSLEEFNIIKHHPIYSYEILRSTGSFSEMVQLGVLYHHERYDGKGYPTGMKGEAIGEVGLVISLADVFDAITTTRQFRKAKPFWYALAQINKGASSAFSPRLAKRFIREIPNFLTENEIFRKGERVVLNTGEAAVVKNYEYPQSFYPVIEIFRSAKGEILRHPIEINLEFDGSRFIEDLCPSGETA